MEKIKYKAEPYAGNLFTDESENNIVNFEKVRDLFFTLNGRKGKIIHSGYTTVYEQGYSGGYDNYMFVFQDDLSSKVLNGGEEFFTDSDVDYYQPYRAVEIDTIP